MKDFLVHKAVWLLDTDSLAQYRGYPELLNQVDLRGMTPLSLALKLDYNHVVQKLLELGADPRCSLSNGWSVIESLCAHKSQDMKALITNLYIHKLLHRTQEYEIKNKATLAALAKIPDFYVEIQWNVQSWVPLVSSNFPSDTFKIWKKGTSIRFDSFVQGFSGTSVVKGHLSYICTKSQSVLLKRIKKHL
eukprot:UN28658